MRLYSHQLYSGVYGCNVRRRLYAWFRYAPLSIPPHTALVLDLRTDLVPFQFQNQFNHLALNCIPCPSQPPAIVMIPVS